MVHAVQLPGGECRGTLFYINSRDSSRACSAIGEWLSRRRGRGGGSRRIVEGSAYGRFTSRETKRERERERERTRGPRSVEQGGR